MSQKNQLFGPILTISLYFNENRSIYDASSGMSLLVKISNKIDYILGNSGQKNSPKAT